MSKVLLAMETVQSRKGIVLVEASGAKSEPQGENP
jgi:hypothetical protein